MYSFGLNDHGQLGIGGSKREMEAPRNTAYPQLVDFYNGESDNPIDVNISRVACGRAHTIALDGKRCL